MRRESRLGFCAGALAFILSAAAAQAQESPDAQGTSAAEAAKETAAGAAAEAAAEAPVAKPTHDIGRAHGDLIHPPQTEPDLERIRAGALGSADNPVRAYLPAGEAAYLSRLKCADGWPVGAVRTGSVEGGPYGNVMDRFEVFCRGKAPQIIYMDMYHPSAIEMRPVDGFTLDDS